MKKNIGNLDRIIRITAALVIAVLIFSESVSGGFGIFLSIIGGLLFLTAAAGDCPVYWLFGINTCSVKHLKGSH